VYERRRKHAESRTETEYAWHSAVRTRRAKDTQESSQSVVAIVSIALAILVVIAAGCSVVRSMRPNAPQTGTIGTHGKGTGARPSPVAEQAFQTGICYKAHSGASNYGPYDQAWQSNLPALKVQTDAGWIEMVVILYQDAHDSTTLYPGPNSTTPGNLARGIAQAHATGLKVFLVPYVKPMDANSVGIAFGDPGSAAAWFDGYWAGFEPYFEVARQQKVEMVAVGSELPKLEGDAYASDWATLIGRIRSVYAGPLTYNLTTESWAADGVNGVPGWMRNTALTYLGVQEYMSLAQQPQDEPEPLIALAWQERVLPRIDAFATASGKTLIISEIGYRNATDALYWPALSWTSTAPDPTLQAAAYQAALDAAVSDPNVHGIYFFAWDEGVFTPSPEALSVLHPVYAALHG
jgi:hypothetical protein